MGLRDMLTNNKDKPELGDLVKDRITGMEGVVECASQWLNSCTRLTIQPVKLSEAGIPLERHTFDAPQLTVITKGYYKLPMFQEKVPGGPSIAPVGRKEQF